MAEIMRGDGAVATTDARRRTRRLPRPAEARRAARGLWHRSRPAHPEFEALLLHFFARDLRASCPYTAGYSVVIAVLATNLVGLDVSLAWALAQAALSGLLHYLTGAVLGPFRSTVHARALSQGLIAIEVARGVAFAAMIGQLVAAGDAHASTFAVVVFVSVAAMAATSSAAVPLAVLAALVPMSAAIILGEARAGFVEGAWPLVVVACGGALYFFHVTTKLHATLLETLATQAEKDALITELSNAKAASDLARRRAEEASQAKSRFLAAMSHELRTPLNAILGFSEVMKGELFGAHVVTSYKEYSNDIHASGQHLLVLINELLDLSRIEAGRIELKEEPVQLDQLVEECHHLLKLRAKHRRISIEAAVEAEMPPLRADERAVRQVILNLLSNAIKFTPKGGSIRIKIGWTASGGQYFSVRDSGPGIPEDEIPLVMTSFGRGTLARKNAEEGSGLGLPIVKGLVEAHGGTFLLKSKICEGTEVVVIFPRGRVTSVRAVQSPAPDIGPSSLNPASDGRSPARRTS